MPKVSIVIPVYRVEKYLTACLDSILAQTFIDWEAVCVNDGSPDNCGKILEKYALKDKRIKVITQDNQGISVARNNGIKKAGGEYILFLDSDDFIHPQLLEICLHFAEKEKADMVSFRFQNYQEGEAVSFPNYQINNLHHILTDTPLYFQKKRHKYTILANVWSKLYKKDLIQDLSFIPGITMEDYPYIYTILAKRPKTAIIDIPLYYYTNNPLSVTSVQITPKNIKDYHVGLNSIIDVYKTTPQKEKNFVLHKLFPNILKQQFNKILRSPQEKQTELYQEFIEELRDINEKGWLKIWGHKISRYLKYKKLIKKGSI